jgi:hypothetical protein
MGRGCPGEFSVFRFRGKNCTELSSDCKSELERPVMFCSCRGLWGFFAWFFEFGFIFRSGTGFLAFMAWFLSFTTRPYISAFFRAS